MRYIIIIHYIIGYPVFYTCVLDAYTNPRSVVYARML